jgi:hypothetical protein
MKSFKMEIELVVDASAADAWSMIQTRVADIARVSKVVDVETGEFVKPVSTRVVIEMPFAKQQ